jgi:hypothetical protein
LCHSRSGVASYFIAWGVSSLIDRLSKHLQDKSAMIDKLVHSIIIAAGFFIAGCFDLDHMLIASLWSRWSCSIAVGLALKAH